MKIRRAICAVLIVPFTMIGCADKEMMQQYYSVEQSRTEMIIKSVERQSSMNATNRMLQMQTFSNAATTAAVTDSPVDDALLAFAWGFQMGQPQKVEIPKLQPIVAPDKTSDLWRSVTPVLGMIMPFLYPLAYGWASSGSGSGTKVSADNGASVVLDSGNPGSYNSVGGDYQLQNSQSDYSIIRDGDNCADCGDDLEDVPETCADNPPGGFSPSGTPLQCEGCSCGSFANGECECSNVIF